MGKLIGCSIEPIRGYVDGNPIPDLDYKQIFPITAYSAVQKTMESGSTTLDVELSNIYRLIGEKQDLVTGGSPGTLMTWTRVNGQIGTTQIARYINDEVVERSNLKVPSERAVGAALDLKTSLSAFNAHKNDLSTHVDESERERWNSAASANDLNAHTSDASIHVTDAERNTWNNSAPADVVDDHIADYSNPHRVSAHQAGTYTRAEIDQLFDNIRESFFNYRNIKYDAESRTAILEQYQDENWNPNYVLAYGEELPSVTEESLTYFALQPKTDYSTNESNVCLIYVKRPGHGWLKVGEQIMNPGDMIIRYPDTTMCVWIAGRFNSIFTDSSGTSVDDVGGGTSMWRPVLTADALLSWRRSSETTAPDPVSIKGADGYTPVKGVDYFDGAPGIGVPTGGNPGEVLVKTDSEDYETEWMTLGDAVYQYLQNGGLIPISAEWGSIVGKPNIVQSTGDSETDVMSQAAVTSELDSINGQLTEMTQLLGVTGGADGLQSSLANHLNDYNNPHHITTEKIGAVSLQSFTEHTLNHNNPHAVNKQQLGLENVDNTRDVDKPISNLTQDALDEINTQIGEINGVLGGASLITSVRWDRANCKLVLQYRNGRTTDVPIPIKEIFQTIRYDDENDQFVITLPDDTEHRISVTSLITDYVGGTSERTRVSVEGNVIKADLLPNTIDGGDIVDSVALRGSPTATTQLPSDKSDKIATTKFVHQQVIDDLISHDEDRPLSANMGRVLNTSKVDTQRVLQIIADTPLMNIIDNLGSDDSYSALSARMGNELQVTKAPMVHTSRAGSVYGQASVEVFGHARASDVDPLMDGIVFRGTDDGRYARADHRHPSDITRAPIHWPDTLRGVYRFTGEPRAVSPDDGVFDDRIATTEWVLNNIGSAVEPMTDEFIQSTIASSFGSTQEVWVEP